MGLEAQCPDSPAAALPSIPAQPLGGQRGGPDGDCSPLDELKEASPPSFLCLRALWEGPCSHPGLPRFSVIVAWQGPHLGASLAAQSSLAVLAGNLVWQLVINSPCTHSLGRVLLAWMPRTLEKRQLSCCPHHCRTRAGMRLLKSRLHGHMGCAGLGWRPGLGCRLEAPFLFSDGLRSSRKGSD